LRRTRKTKSREKAELSRLLTEQVNPASHNLDRKSSLEIARIINAEDEKVARAVRRVVPEIAHGIDLICGALSQGGRLIYVGAGTSGRIAALDAVEVPPTFDVNPKLVQFLMAGGPKALASAIESKEDSETLGRQEMAKRKPGKKDIVVGIAASGRTPFTVAALRHARSKGAKTIAVTCNRNSVLGKVGHLDIAVEVGSEIISGSTRMKAGTAQKMVLNMLSSGAMARLGYAFDGMMSNLRLRNHKLLERGITILQNSDGLARDEAKKYLQRSGNNVPTALVMIKAGVDRRQAERALKEAHGHVRKAIASLLSL
jgi:N-acetylmuramic acid 6-phosphate etherase